MSGNKTDSLRNFSRTPPNKTVNNNVVTDQTVEILQLIGEILLLIVTFWWTIGVAIFRLLSPPTEKSVKGEVVLITGAGHGIGKELALEYASKGATVVCWDVNQKGNSETVQEIQKFGNVKAYAYQCNVANRQEVMDTAKKVLKEVGDVSILINNAGIMPCRPFWDQTVDEIERTMNINVMAHYWTLQAFLSTMQKNNHGHIVALSSMAGQMGFRNLMPYCASKFAVRGMMEALFHDLRVNPNNQIKLTLIYPYIVNTGLCKNPKIRFPQLMDLLDPKMVAKHIVRAQRRDVFETTVPRFWLSWLYIMRLLPVKSLVLLLDFAGTYLDTDL